MAGVDWLGEAEQRLAEQRRALDLAHVARAAKDDALERTQAARVQASAEAIAWRVDDTFIDAPAGEAVIALRYRYLADLDRIDPQPF